MASNGKSCDYDTLTIMVQYQTGLDMIGVGAAGQVYNVDDNIVLKACIIFQPPTSNCTERDLWYHASETVFNFGLLKDEKAVHRLLTQHPHPNIMEAINTTRPEGIYLRKYQPFPDGALPPQPDRIFWYQDIIRALLHLHSLGIAHSDIRKDNIFLDSHGRAVLCYFSASCPFGYPNASRATLFHGIAETVLDASDRFAM